MKIIEILLKDIDAALPIYLEQYNKKKDTAKAASNKMIKCVYYIRVFFIFTFI